jgi:hypothetical protein
VFEEIVRRCIAAGLVDGRHLTVDGTLVQANASPLRRVAPDQLAEVARVSHTVQDYLAELEQQNPMADPAPPAHADPKAAARWVSASDPDAAWAVKWGRAGFAYFNNYLIDNASRVIVGVEATPARFRQEALAARRMLEQVAQLGLRPESVGADKAYGSGEFLAGLLTRGVQPHRPLTADAREAHVEWAHCCPTERFPPCRCGARRALVNRHSKNGQGRRRD